MVVSPRASTAGRETAHLSRALLAWRRNLSRSAFSLGDKSSSSLLLVHISVFNVGEVGVGVKGPHRRGGVCRIERKEESWGWVG